MADTMAHNGFVGGASDVRRVSASSFAAVVVSIILGVSVAVVPASGASDVPSPDTSSDVRMRCVDDAIATHDVTAAIRAWYVAFAIAAARGTCDGLFDVGDAALRIGDATGWPNPEIATARYVYRAAVGCARDHRSLAGLVRGAGAFAALGDRDAAIEAAQQADTLAQSTADARTRGFVHDFGTWLAHDRATPQPILDDCCS